MVYPRACPEPEGIQHFSHHISPPVAPENVWANLTHLGGKAQQRTQRSWHTVIFQIINISSIADSCFYVAILKRPIIGADPYCEEV